MHNTNIWWYMLIKFSKQIGNSLAKIINTKVNSRPWQTSEMELFPKVVTGFRGASEGNSESFKHLRWSFLQK